MTSGHDMGWSGAAATLAGVSWEVAAGAVCECAALAVFLAATLFGLPMIGIGLGLVP